MFAPASMSGSGEAVRPRGVWTLLALGALLAYTTWVWGGLRPSYHRGGVGLAVAVLVSLNSRVSLKNLLACQFVLTSKKFADQS